MNIHVLRKLELAFCVNFYILQEEWTLEICAQIYVNTTFLF